MAQSMVLPYTNQHHNNRAHTLVPHAYRLALVYWPIENLFILLLWYWIILNVKKNGPMVNCATCALTITIGMAYSNSIPFHWKSITFMMMMMTTVITIIVIVIVITFIGNVILYTAHSTRTSCGFASRSEYHRIDIRQLSTVITIRHIQMSRFFLCACTCKSPVAIYRQSNILYALIVYPLAIIMCNWNE